MIQSRTLFAAAALSMAMPATGRAQTWEPGLDPGCAREREMVLAEAGTPGVLRGLAFEALEICVAERAILLAAARSQAASRATARALADCAPERRAVWAEETTPGVLLRLMDETLNRCLDRRPMGQAAAPSR
jgi:hypothetical protein